MDSIPEAPRNGGGRIMELIDKKKALADLRGIKDVLQAQGDPFLANIINRAIDCIKGQPVIAVREVESDE